MSKKKSNFRNQTVSDARRQKKEAASYGYLNLPKGVKIFNIKEKTREILMDIIPYVVTDKRHPDRDADENRAIVDGLWYKRPFKTHRDIGVNNDTFVCLTSIGKKCPICDYVTEQRRKGAEWDDLKDIAAKHRNLYAVIPIDSDDHDEVGHVWEISRFLFQNELNDQLEEDPDNGIFPDLEEGLTLKVKLKWKKFGKNSFAETRDITFEERNEQYTEDVLEDVPNLDEILNVLSYKELEAKFLDMEGEETDENDAVTDVAEDEKPEKPTFRRKKDTEPKEKKEKEKDEKPKRTRGSKKDKCPHNLRFGKDCASDKICEECDLWDDCDEEQTKQE